jgi:hypothetical protein
MQRNRLFTHFLHGTLAAGALALTSGTGVALADDNDRRGRRGDDRDDDRRDRIQDRIQAALARRAAVGVLAADATGGALDKLNFTVTTARGDVKVTTNGSTRFRRFNSNNAVQVSDFTKGARVAVEGRRESGDTLVARTVVIGVPNNPGPLTRTEGTVTGIDTSANPNKVTVQPSASGAAAVTFNVMAQTRVSLVGTTQLKTGQVVTVVTRTGSQDALLIRQHAS